MILERRFFGGNHCGGGHRILWAPTQNARRHGQRTDRNEKHRKRRRVLLIHVSSNFSVTASDWERLKDPARSVLPEDPSHGVIVAATSPRATVRFRLSYCQRRRRGILPMTAWPSKKYRGIVNFEFPRKVSRWWGLYDRVSILKEFCAGCGLEAARTVGDFVPRS